MYNNPIDALEYIKKFMEMSIEAFKNPMMQQQQPMMQQQQPMMQPQPMMQQPQPMMQQQQPMTVQDVVTLIQAMNNKGMYRNEQPQTVEQITADIINPPNLPEYGMEGNGGRGENGQRYDIYANFNRNNVNN